MLIGIVWLLELLGNLAYVGYKGGVNGMFLCGRMYCCFLFQHVEDHCDGRLQAYVVLILIMLGGFYGNWQVW